MTLIESTRGSKLCTPCVSPPTSACDAAHNSMSFTLICPSEKSPTFKPLNRNTPFWFKAEIGCHKCKQYSFSGGGGINTIAKVTTHLSRISFLNDFYFNSDQFNIQIICVFFLFDTLKFSIPPNSLAV